MAMVLALIQGKEGEISKEASRYLMKSYLAAEGHIQAHGGEEKACASTVIETGQRHVMGLALLDARFHVE